MIDILAYCLVALFLFLSSVAIIEIKTEHKPESKIHELKKTLIDAFSKITDNQKDQDIKIQTMVDIPTTKNPAENNNFDTQHAQDLKKTGTKLQKTEQQLNKSAETDRVIAAEDTAGDTLQANIANTQVKPDNILQINTETAENNIQPETTENKIQQETEQKTEPEENLEELIKQYETQLNKSRQLNSPKNSAD